MTQNISLPRVRPQFAMSLILVLGSTACLWLFFYGGLMMFSALELLADSPQESTRKDLRICVDGQVVKVISESVTNGSSSIKSYRYETLAGTPIEKEDLPAQLHNTATISYWSPDERSSNSDQTAGVMGFRNPEQPDRYWYFYYSLNDQFFGQGHFEVFDRQNQQRLFYLGKKGKTETFPASDEQFVFRLTSNLGRETLITPSNQPSVIPDYDIEDDQLQSHKGSVIEILLLTEAGELWRSNLKAETIEKLPGISDVKGLLQHGFYFLEPEEEVGKRILPIANCWYTPEEITIHVDGHPNRIYTLKIPERLQQKNRLQFTVLPDKTILYQVSTEHTDTHKFTTDLYWADRDGNIVKEHLAALEFSYNSRIRDSLLTYLAMWPYPVLFTVALFTESETGPPHFAYELFWQNLQAGWDLALLLYGLALVLTIVYWLRCRQKKLPQVWWHFLFVLAFGPLGYFSLWLQQKSTTADLPEPAEERLGIDIVHPQTTNVSVVPV